MRVSVSCQKAGRMRRPSFGTHTLVHLVWQNRRIQVTLDDSRRKCPSWIARVDFLDEVVLDRFVHAYWRALLDEPRYRLRDVQLVV